MTLFIKVNKALIMKLLNHTSFYLFLLLMLGTISCKDKVEDKFSLGDLKAYNPYKGDETLIFVDTANNLLTLKGVGRFTEYRENPAGINTNKINLTEVDDSRFYSSDSNYSIAIHMEAACCGQDFMSIFFSWDRNPSSGFYNYDPVFVFPLPISSDPHTPFYNYLKVLNKTYYNVYCSVCFDYNYPVPFPKKLYYTKNEGIIQFDYNDGTTLKLKEVLPAKN